MLGYAAVKTTLTFQMSGDSTTKADFLLTVFTYSGSALALVFVYPFFPESRIKQQLYLGMLGHLGKQQWYKYMIPLRAAVHI